MAALQTRGEQSSLKSCSLNRSALCVQDIGAEVGTVGPGNRSDFRVDRDGAEVRIVREWDEDAVERDDGGDIDLAAFAGSEGQQQAGAADGNNLDYLVRHLEVYSRGEIGRRG